MAMGCTGRPEAGGADDVGGGLAFLRDFSEV
jgi:hypothetical protein